MSLWDYTHFFQKNKVDFFTKSFILLFLFLFAYTLFLIFYSWSNFEGSFLLFVVPLPFYVIASCLLLKYRHLLKTKSQRTVAHTKQDKYEKTGLSEAFSQELKEKLEDLMDTQKLYLNHELRLDDIANMLNISRHHASQVINENFNMSFYDFINTYRIEEAKNKLCNNFKKSSESISDIAYQCGFNNRVSFYKAFKKRTKITPKEFIQNAA
ncbi:helix-turn-helix domain-containing protein [Flagellimonas sp.]|uniref:helix-turn-helix domain-containing protein n=1 Tax=Flagellimonas sp. TaxID=2058762 RepID=UPI003BAB8642